MASKEDLSVHEEWIEAVCAALDVPRDAVDLDAVLGLAGRVAHRVARPMAPVSTFLLGYALGAAGGSLDELRQRVQNVPSGAPPLA